jgi:hypothetical protein
MAIQSNAPHTAATVVNGRDVMSTVAAIGPIKLVRKPAKENSLSVAQGTAKRPDRCHGRHHASRGCAMRAYLKAIAIIFSLMGTYLALLPFTA